MNATPTSAESEKKPLSLKGGLIGGLIVTLVFLNGYKLFGETTAKGWLATLSAAFELYGVILIASPELRPIAARAGVAWAAALRRVGRRTKVLLTRLLRLRREQRITLGSAVDVSSALGLDVKRGYAVPGDAATIDEKVAFLLDQVKRLVGLVEGLENTLRKELEGVHAELARQADDLRNYTAAAVREVAEAELRMRLLGVGFVIVGIAFGYAANLA